MTSQPAANLIIYEYPCNERIRSFLRLEYLFQRLFSLRSENGAESERMLLATLFDLIEVTERGDVRSSLLQEIDKQKETLQSYRSRPESDPTVIDQVMVTLSRAYLDLHQSSKIGSTARESEWLSKLKNRFSISGGTSGVEFPAFQAWQAGPKEARDHCIEHWVSSFIPLYNAITEMLNLIRAAGSTEIGNTNEEGIYEKKLSGQPYQLVRMWLPSDSMVFPEVSINKHVAFVRLIQLGHDCEIKVINRVFSFKLAFCKF
ncbi:cell division protein ZapD [Brackiella oedipodis]|uniref:cell division protein ZapD n=1 Tax=Brackiella oedipodis TaxID=124225 RepID=UPI000571DF08|nr:cell division protein ZapD [Brackiella oedipodis]